MLTIPVLTEIALVVVIVGLGVRWWRNRIPLTKDYPKLITTDDDTTTLERTYPPKVMYAARYTECVDCDAPGDHCMEGEGQRQSGFMPQTEEFVCCPVGYDVVARKNPDAPGGWDYICARSGERLPP